MTEPANSNSTAHHAQDSAVSAVGSAELERLHKMSRTAGLGDNTYVAVNAMAVASIIFGLGSAIVVFSPMLLVVPIVSVLLGIFGLFQIRDSNGTQAGKGVAWLGILLAIGFSAWLGSKNIQQMIATRSDGRDVAQTLQTFGDAVSSRNYDAAYALVSDRLTAEISIDEFKSRLESMQNSPDYGKIRDMHWNELVEFDTDPRTGQRIAVTVALIDLASGSIDRDEARLTKVNGKWMINSLPRFLPPKPDPNSDTAGKVMRPHAAPRKSQ